MERSVKQELLSSFGLVAPDRDCHLIFVVEYKIIIQGIGKSYFEHINLLRYYELKNEIRIIGVTGAEKGIAGIDGYRFIPKEDLKNVEFDYLVVAAPKFYKEKLIFRRQH